MLTKQNSGKYASKEWHEDREEAAEDRSKFTDEELTYLEITGTEGMNRKEVYRTNTTPIDSDTTSKKIDARDRPETGRC